MRRQAGEVHPVVHLVVNLSRMVRVVAALRVNKLIHLRLTEIGDVSFIGGERAGVYRTPTSYRLPASSTTILAENRLVWGGEVGSTGVSV